MKTKGQWDPSSAKTCLLPVRAAAVGWARQELQEAAAAVAHRITRSSERLPPPLLPAPPGIYFSLKAPPVSVMLRSPPPPPTGNYWCESPVTFSQALKLSTKKTLGDRAETEMLEKDGLDAERYEI